MARRGFLEAIDGRGRFALCLAAAVAIHAPGALSFRPSRLAAIAPPPASVLPPVTFADVVTIDEPPPAPPSPAPPPPAPPAPPTPAAPAAAPPEAERHATVAPAPRPARREPSVAKSERSTPKPRESAAADREVSKAAGDAAAFGGEHGAFRALVCLLPRGTASARAVEACKPVAKFRTDAINVSPRNFRRGFPGVETRVDWFGVDYRGRFRVRATGYYTFRLISDDGALLFIDGEQVIDNDGIHSAKEAKLSMPLSAGEHEFRLLYYQGPGHRLALQLFVKGYQTEERPFAPEF